MLNLLTPDVVTAAPKEIQTRVRISLDWPLSMPTHPSFGRDPFKQELIRRTPHCVNDDILMFNTQCSSQWDGFRHYANQRAKRYYNGSTQEEIEGSDVIGIHGEYDRGVLVQEIHRSF